MTIMQTRLGYVSVCEYAFYNHQVVVRQLSNLTPPPYSSVPNSRASTQHVFWLIFLDSHALIMVRFLQHIRSRARKIFSLIFPQITLIRTFTAIRDTRVGTYNKSGNIGCFRQVAVALTYMYIVFTTLCVLYNPLKRKSFLVLATRRTSKSIVISLCRL